MMCIVNLLNNNQGFVMGVLTLVYVSTTVLIWLSNKKSAEAASKQLKEMESTQQQNVRFQLFERRYDIHKTLSHWFNVASKVFTITHTDRKRQNSDR